MSKIRLHGSSSGYTDIAPVAASGNNTLTLPNDGTIISKDAAGAVGVTSVVTDTIKVGAAVTISESGVDVVGVGTFSGAISAGAASNIVGGLTIDAGNGDTGLSMDVAGSGNYVIKESSSDDVMQYGTGATSCYKHNFSSGMVSVNNGHGSVADFYPCRAWANISGDSSPATIRVGKNINAISDNGTGDYTVTFTNAMPDTNYAFTMCRGRGGAQDGGVIQYSTKSTTQIRMRSWKENFTGIDDSETCVMIFR